VRPTHFEALRAVCMRCHAAASCLSTCFKLNRCLHRQGAGVCADTWGEEGVVLEAEQVPCFGLARTVSKYFGFDRITYGAFSRKTVVLNHCLIQSSSILIRFWP